MTETTTEKVSAVLAVLSQLGMLPCMTLVPCLDVESLRIIMLLKYT
jgi:hypothetical protein